MAECHYLGHIVGKGQVKPEEAKVTAINNFKRPISKKDVRSFLGLASYYRRFVPGFSTIAAPLSDLTKNNEPEKVKWTETTEIAFTTLKSWLVSDAVLMGPNYNKQFILQTDASDVGIGATLSQLDEEGSDRPIAYFSRKLLPREVNYATVDRECLAIVDGIRHFSIFLTGVPFTVVTDHHCLRFLDSVKDNGGRRTRWTLALQEYDYTVQHRAGSLNGNADGLSRQAWNHPPEGAEGGVMEQDSYSIKSVPHPSTGLEPTSSHQQLEDNYKVTTEPVNP